jgi:hypothetical protein
MGELLLSRRDSTIVARHEVPGIMHLTADIYSSRVNDLAPFQGASAGWAVPRVSKRPTGEQKQPRASALGTTRTRKSP